MQKYLATVRVGGSAIKTVVFADFPLHARLLLQYQYGMGSILVPPSPISETSGKTQDHELIDGVIKPVKPLTPAQTRIQGLKQNVERTRLQLKAEQDRQRKQREAERTRKSMLPNRYV